MRRQRRRRGRCVPVAVCGCWQRAAKGSAWPVRSGGPWRRSTLEEASTLFRERAEAGGGDTATGDAALVERICGRLDGLPLAVELAAARTRSLSLADVVDRIDDRFRLLTTGGRAVDPRQQTLRQVVDWSYDLLSSEEQRVFRRLSVFAGGFDLAAAEALAAGDDVDVTGIVDILGQLVDKSLISVADRDAGTRYRLLQTLVDYGRGRLTEAAEAETTSDRHLHGWSSSPRRPRRGCADLIKPAGSDGSAVSWTTGVPRWSGPSEADGPPRRWRWPPGWPTAGTSPAPSPTGRPSSPEPSQWTANRRRSTGRSPGHGGRG